MKEIGSAFMKVPKFRCKKRFHIVGAILSFVTAFAVYLFSRPSNLLFYQWIPRKVAEVFININNAYSLNLPDWIVYNSVDGLWLFSFFLLSYPIWGKDENKMMILFAIVMFLAACGWEILQLFQIISGSFDVLDIVAYSIALITYIIIHNYEKKH